MTESHEPRQLVTRREAAEALQVSVRTVERYITDGKLDAYKTHTGRVAITQESIDALLTLVPIGGAA